MQVFKSSLHVHQPEMKCEMMPSGTGASAARSLPALFVLSVVAALGKAALSWWWGHAPGLSVLGQKGVSPGAVLSLSVLCLRPG